MSKEFQIKQGTHIVIKVDDIKKYLNEFEKRVLMNSIKKIEECRLSEQKQLNDYYVVNRDEPYATSVFLEIVNGEMKKGNDNE